MTSPNIEEILSTVKEKEPKVVVICGPMFAGKTTTLLAVYKALKGKKKVVIKHSFDDRYSKKNVIVTHDSKRIPCIPCKTIQDIKNIEKLKNADYILIDEVQFFDTKIKDLIVTLVNLGKSCICFGLDKDYKGEGFDTMKELLPIADYIYKLKGVCSFCGAESNFSFLRKNQLSTSSSNIIVGGGDKYEPLCRGCYNVFSLMKTNKQK